MRPFFPALGMLALVGGLLAGCGDDDGGGASGGSAASFCDQAEELETRFASLEGSTEPTPELFEEVSTAFGDLAEEAPADIRDDMETLAAALAGFAEIAGEIDPEDPESLATLEEEAARIEEESGNLEEAGDNVEAYFRDECGIDLDDSVESGGETGTELDDEG